MLEKKAQLFVPVGNQVRFLDLPNCQLITTPPELFWLPKK